MEIVCIKFMPIKRQQQQRRQQQVSAQRKQSKNHRDKQQQPSSSLASLQMRRLTNGPTKATIEKAQIQTTHRFDKLLLRHHSNQHYRQATTLSKHLLVILLLVSYHLLVLIHLDQHNSVQASERMVRLCIASVDPVKLSSQCVMCNRREFPLTVIDCTGITKVNDLIANPLSVQEATCLIYNCRRQVPDVKPEPYHGSVSHAANYRQTSSASSPSGYSPFGAAGPSATGSRNYEMMTPSGMFGGGYSAMQPQMPPNAMYMSRYGANAGPLGYGGASLASMYPPAAMAMSPLIPKGLIGGPRGMPDRQQGPLPYALVPASSFPFGSRKYKMALMPLFK